MTKLKILAPSLLATLCFAAPLGIFDGESGVAEMRTPGHAAFNPTYGEYSVTGGGDIAGTSDGFHFVWKKVSGDVNIGADIRFSTQGVAGGQQAAIMIRQSLDPRAIYAAAVLHGDGRAAFQYRPDTGAMSKSTEVIAHADLSTTLYLTLERHGDAFTMSAGKVGRRGGSGIPLGSPVTVTMNGPVYVGLAVASSDPASQATAVFSNVY